ncbi:MAG: hypothetical protein CME70_16680 [Halobacteriovorax sp.]|nr:hypothetical protein [Halobacteriovorax sp.]|tara:strand:+ start:83178 stop:84488 length:1311 start_codon:yes stop_codon:yes gene_type:complete
MNELKHQSILPENFREIFPEDVYELIVQISRQGFGLTLVGGAVRDYILEGKLSNDLDFELRHSFEYSEDEWKKMIRRLGETLKNKYSYHVEILNFEILKIKIGSYEVELSSPRVETYTGKAPFGHSEFEVELSPLIPYNKSFLRRDFTINSMAIEFGVPGADDEFRFIDPFNGIGDLKNKILRPCSESFYYDPVRFLRLIRFSNKLDFTFEGDPSLFDLTELTAHYFFQESLKDFFLITKKFFLTIQEYKISLAIDLKDLEFLTNLNFGEFGQLLKDEVLLALTFSSEEITLEDRMAFCRIAGMKSTAAEDYEKLKSYLSALRDEDDGTLKRLLRHSTFVELLDNDILIEIQKLMQLYNRHRFGTLEILEKIDPSIYKRFVFFKNIFGSETKGKIVANKLMKLVDKKEKRSIISLYCHLLVYYDLRPILPESRFGS